MLPRPTPRTPIHTPIQYRRYVHPHATSPLSVICPPNQCVHGCPIPLHSFPGLILTPTPFSQHIPPCTHPPQFLFKDISKYLPLAMCHTHKRFLHLNRFLHTLAGAADNGLTRTSGWRGPIKITWCDSVDMLSIPIHCKWMGGWFVLKSIAHRSRYPIELCLPIDVGRKLMITCTNYSFICGMQQTKSLKLFMFTCKRQAWDLSRQSTPNSPIIYQHFLSWNLWNFAWDCC